MSAGAARGTVPRLGGVLLCAALLLLPLAGHGANLGVHDDGTTNPCKRCHDTASGLPALCGWAGTLPETRFKWFSPITQLCLYCHNQGTYAGASPMLRLAADAGAHGLDAGTVWTPDSWRGGERERKEDHASTKLPYTTSVRLECTTCHNVHVFKNRPFNQRADIESLCTGCHAGRINPGNVGAANGAEPEPNYSTHPTGVTVADLPGNGVTSFEKADPRLTVAIVSNDPQGRWVLGGHLADPSLSDAASTPFTCQTCHAVHGSADRPGEHGPGLPAIYERGNPSALCTGCHRIESGHPTRGVAGGEFRPREFVSPRGIPSAWEAERHFDRGATPFDPAASEAPACTSCHDLHGGLAGTSLLYGPNTVGAGSGNWCFNCHPARTLLPVGHKPLGDAGREAAPECGQCHRVEGEAKPLSWKAHNGFGRHGLAQEAPTGK